MSVADKNSPILLTYQRMKLAWGQYKTTPDKLNEKQLEKLHMQVQSASKMIATVLASNEASHEKVSNEEINFIVTHLSDQFSNKAEFDTALLSQELTKKELKLAIYQDLLCEKTVHTQGLKHDKVSRQQASYYYHKNREKFHHPERRKVSHILITINEEYPENSREKVVSRLTKIEQSLATDVNQFAKLAEQYSECPTALNGGLIGSVVRGQLHPELDSVLFSMCSGDLSGKIESEIGLHILLCTEIIVKGEKTEQDALHEIRKQMNLHRAQKQQKLWITSLLKG